MTNKEQSFARYLGLCRRAGGVIRGGETILRAVRAENASKRPALVLIAGDASERTTKQLINKCQFYNIPYSVRTEDSYSLAKLTGFTSPCAALAVLKGRGPVDALLTVCSDRTQDSITETKTLPHNHIKDVNSEANRLLDRKDDGEWQ